MTVEVEVFEWPVVSLARGAQVRLVHYIVDANGSLIDAAHWYGMSAAPHLDVRVDRPLAEEAIELTAEGWPPTAGRASRGSDRSDGALYRSVNAGSTWSRLALGERHEFARRPLVTRVWDSADSSSCWQTELPGLARRGRDVDFPRERLAGGRAGASGRALTP